MFSVLLQAEPHVTQDAVRRLSQRNDVTIGSRVVLRVARVMTDEVDGIALLR